MDTANTAMLISISPMKRVFSIHAAPTARLSRKGVRRQQRAADIASTATAARFFGLTGPDWRGYNIEWVRIGEIQCTPFPCAQIQS